MKFRGISRNYTTRNSAEFRRNFSQFWTEYGIDGSKKNRRNSVSTEFRGHPTFEAARRGEGGGSGRLWSLYIKLYYHVQCMLWRRIVLFYLSKAGHEIKKIKINPQQTNILVGHSEAQSRQSAKRFSIRWNWDSPTPLAAGECAPPPCCPGGRAHSLAAKRVGESQFQRGNIDCGALYCKERT